MKNSQIRRGRNCVYLLHSHLVFVTKYRYNVFTSDQLDYLKQVVENICLQNDCELVEFNGEEDHVHLLINYPPTKQLSKLVNSFKGVTSRKLRQKYEGITDRYYKGVLWSPSYFAGSVGGATIDVVKKYIEKQQRP